VVQEQRPGHNPAFLLESIVPGLLAYQLITGAICPRPCPNVILKA